MAASGLTFVLMIWRRSERQWEMDREAKGVRGSGIERVKVGMRGGQ